MKDSFNRVCDTNFHGDFNAEISHSENKVRLTGQFALPNDGYDYAVVALPSIDEKMNSGCEEDELRLENYLLTIFDPHPLMGSFAACSSLEIDETFDVKPETTHVNIFTVKPFGKAETIQDEIYIDLER